MPTTGRLSLRAPVEPRNTASPKAKIPPSAATSQYPLLEGVDAMPTTGELRAAPAPAPAPSEPAPAAPVAAAGPVAAPGLQLSEIRETDPAGVGSVSSAPIASLVVSDPAAMGGPRTIDSGAPLWMLIPLVVVGLTLFSASCAVAVNEMRQRRVRARVKA